MIEICSTSLVRLSIWHWMWILSKQISYGCKIFLHWTSFIRSVFPPAKSTWHNTYDDISLAIQLVDFDFKECGEILVDSVVEIFCKIYYLLTFQFSAGDILRGYIQHIISNKNTTIAAWIPQNLTEKHERKPREEI